MDPRSRVQQKYIEKDEMESTAVMWECSCRLSEHKETRQISQSVKQTD